MNRKTASQKKPAKAARKTAVIQKMTTRVAGEIITEG
jgi:hypothetical protein